jgi:murein DD-endopeptidase MepM/ murein hydrolase activator NlpD
MTNRKSASPCVVSPLLLEKVRMYETQVGPTSLATGFRRVLRSLVLCAGIGAMAIGPVAAAAPPVPKSRPSLDRLQASIASAKGDPARVGARLASRLRTLSGLLAKTGLDVDRLVAAAPPAEGQLSDGQGGPLLAATGRGAGRAAERAAAAELDRLRRMQSVLLAMPLAAPMTEYKLNSGFGYRRDPFRRRGAVHTGLDFGGPRNAPILATAPGEVIESGRAGAYGIMVVIDHGMGIETRYAHLSRALVRVGDRVATGRTIGVMGRTGRATGHHLHYEIRVDGRALNPKPFIEAGTRLAGG